MEFKNTLAAKALPSLLHDWNGAHPWSDGSQQITLNSDSQIYDNLLSPNCTVRGLDVLTVEKNTWLCGIFMSIVFSRQLGSMHFKDNWSHWTLWMPVVPLSHLVGKAVKAIQLSLKIVNASCSLFIWKQKLSASTNLISTVLWAEVFFVELAVIFSFGFFLFTTLY